MSIRIEFHDPGFRELRTSSAAKELVKGHADDMAQRANSVPSTTDPEATEPYYGVQDGTDQERARYRVYAASGRAEKHEARTQALQRSL